MMTENNNLVCYKTLNLMVEFNIKPRLLPLISLYINDVTIYLPFSHSRHSIGREKPLQRKEVRQKGERSN